MNQLFNPAKGLVLAIAIASATSAHATIFNSGIDTNGDRIDDHWNLTGISTVAGLPATASIPNAYLVTTQAGNFPFGPWIANDNVSKWITYSDGLFIGTDTTTRTFSYTQTFTSGNTTALIRWLSDNDSYVYLDNNLVGSRVSGGSNFTTWNNWVNLNLTAGSHTLRIDVVNIGISGGGNPTGLRFEAVPEPSTYVAAALLMLPVAAQLRRMRAARQK